MSGPTDHGRMVALRSPVSNTFRDTLAAIAKRYEDQATLTAAFGNDRRAAKLFRIQEAVDELLIALVDADEDVAALLGNLAPGRLP